MAHEKFIDIPGNSAQTGHRAAIPSAEYITVNGCRLHFVRQGRGTPTVLLHGSDGFLQDFAPVLEQCSGEEGELLAFDRPGHGESEAPLRQGGTLPVQAGLLHNALAQLGVERPILLCHSWSGALALYYALQYPSAVSGLVLLNPWVYPDSDPPIRLIQVAERFGSRLAHLALLLTPLKRRLLHHSLAQAFAPDSVPPDYERQAIACWLRTRHQVAVFLQENIDTWALLPLLAQEYAKITVPVVIVAGDQDPVVQPKHQALRLHRALPHSDLIVLAKTGHELPQTRPDAVLKATSLCRQMILAAPPAPEPDLNPGPPEPARLDRPSLASSLPTGWEGSSRRVPAALEDDIVRARDLVYRFGWNTTAYQILNPEIVRWFAPDGEAVVGYVSRHKTRVAAGAPICDAERIGEVVAQFEQAAAGAGELVCWFAAAERLRAALPDQPSHAALTIGAQPVWDPSHWPEVLAKNRSLRAQLNRARNKGITVSEWSADQASRSAELQRCLEEWLNRHPLPTLHFLTEPVTLDRLMDRRIFVAEHKSGLEKTLQGTEDRPETKTAVGFLIATPAPARSGWLVEQIARGKEAPNGTPELLVDAAMQALAADGYVYVTLGLVPLTRRVSGAPSRLSLRLLLAWARQHGRRFYNFEGLDAFKAKFKPDAWEPLYAISNEPHFRLRTLVAIAAAFSDGPLLWSTARALASAARQEAAWLGRRLRDTKSPRSP